MARPLRIRTIDNADSALESRLTERVEDVIVIVPVEKKTGDISIVKAASQLAGSAGQTYLRSTSPPQLEAALTVP